MSSITLLVTTYNRPNRVRWLLDDIVRYQHTHDLTVFIWDDGSDHKLTLPSDRQVAWHYHHNLENLGKPRYWETCTSLYQWVEKTEDAKGYNTNYYCQLPDDVRLVPDFFNRVIEHWEAITDSWKVCLNPLLDRERISNPCWTGNIGEYVSFGPYRFRNAPWNDCCWFAERRFLEQLDFMYTPIPEARWARHPGMGSGVGPQLTDRLLGKRFHFYHMADYPLVHHGAHESLMHPGRISAGKTTTTERVIAGMATYKHPARQVTAIQAVASVIDQVHEIHIYCNNYKKEDIPSLWERNPKIRIYLSSDRLGDLTDLGKFYVFHDPSIHGYFISIDDDIIYPPTYVASMLCELEYYNCACLVGYHGAILNTWPVPSFYKYRRVFHNQSQLDADTPVHILGTGCLAFHTRLFRPEVHCDMAPCMADVHIARQAQDQGKAAVCLAHERQSIKILDVPDTIFDRYAKPGEDVHQTMMVNERPWAVFPAPIKYNE